MRNEGLLIVTHMSLTERLKRYRQPVSYNIGMPVLEMSHEEVAARYHGFEGDPWGDRDWEKEYSFLPESGLGELSQYEQIQTIFLNEFGRESDLIYIGGVSAPAGLPDEFKFVGYDYGYYESPGSYYSVIYSEIIYGGIPTMLEFASSLNENLLFSTAEEAERLGVIRQSLLDKGVGGLEDDSDEWYTFGLWRYSVLESRGIRGCN
jgi:hypothetical protein